MTTFTLLVGLPGSGKSYIAQDLLYEKRLQKKQVVVLSSDLLRSELLGDENDQTQNQMIFDEMNQRTITNLKNGVDVIYDATNLSRKKRMSLLNQLPKDVEKVCVIVWAKVSTCILRDSQRDRSVGKDVIYKMLKQFETPWYTEGWTDITRIINDSDCYKDLDFDLDIPHDNPHHPGTIQEHIERVKLAVWDDYRNLNLEDEAILTKVAHLHDIGKPFCKTFYNTKGELTDRAHYYGHENVSAYIALNFINCQTLDKLLLSFIINMHMQPHLQGQSNFYKKLGSKNDLDKKVKELIERFCVYDSKGA